MVVNLSSVREGAGEITYSNPVTTFVRRTTVYHPVCPPLPPCGWCCVFWPCPLLSRSRAVPVRPGCRSRAVALRRPRAVPGRNGCKPPRGRPPLKGFCPDCFRTALPRPEFVPFQ